MLDLRNDKLFSVPNVNGDCFFTKHSVRYMALFDHRVNCKLKLIFTVQLHDNGLFILILFYFELIFEANYSYHHVKLIN